MGDVDSVLRLFMMCTDNHMYQYFLQVVPTNVDTTFSSLDTYQYAATENVSV